jgi:hypothetical protein
MDTTRTSDAEASQRESSPSGAAPAWEMIESGRYRPRRIRGSCVGRELG